MVSFIHKWVGHALHGFDGGVSGRVQEARYLGVKFLSSRKWAMISSKDLFSVMYILKHSSRLLSHS